MSEKIDFSIVVPFYNEESGVGQVLEELTQAFQKAQFNFEILAVDNGSRDKTGTIIDSIALKHSFIKKVRVDQNQGYGWGQISGMRQALGRWVVMSHGDGQLQAHDLLRILEEVKNRQIILAKGVRPVRTEGAWRRVVSASYNALFKSLFSGVSARDINSPPKIIERSLLDKLGLTSKDWFIDAELIIKSAREGVTPVEFSIEIAPRCAGESHVRVSTIVEFFKNLAIWLVTNGRAWRS